MSENKVFLINRGETSSRLDAVFYSPRRTRAIRALRESGRRLERLAEVGDFVDEIVSEIPPGLEYVGLENIESGAGDYSHAEEKDGISAARVFRAGQVLFSRLRPYLNKVALAKSGGVCSTEIYAIQARALRPEYLAAFLRSDIVLSQTEYMMTGATLPRLQLADVKDLLIPILSEREQNRIIRVIEAARAKKEKAARQARELLAQADDFLLSELGVEMPAADRGAKVFYRRFDELSGNRLDPFYYRDEFLRLEEKAASSPFPKARLGEMLSDIRYGASVGNNYADEGIPILRISDLKPNEISADEIVYLPEIDRKRLGGCFVRAGDFLVSRSGTIGVVARIRDDYDGFAFGSFMIKFSLRDGAPVNPSYLSFFLNSPLGSKFFERNRVGAVQGNITIPIIRNTLLILPPLVVQTKIAARIMKIRAQADKIRAEAAEAFRLAKLEVERIILKNQPRKNNV